MNKKLNTPVLFLTFNRLDTAKQVFSAISEAKPPRLYVASDGAREGVEGEKDKVDSVRSYVLNNINWDCEVKTLFRDRNLGCGKAVSEAITWFFDDEEQGIILEDDCLPSQSFFWFCEELLERYNKEDKIGMISGDNFLFNKFRIDSSYYFSEIPHIWGWATWRRSWSLYDHNMSKWSQYKKSNNFSKKMGMGSRKYYFRDVLNKTFSGKIDTWDYKWLFCFFYNNLVSINPSVNLIKNIGFDQRATHTKNVDSVSANIENKDIDFKLIHPDNDIIPNKRLDEYVYKNHFQIKCVASNGFTNLIKKFVPATLHGKIKKYLKIVYGN